MKKVGHKQLDDLAAGTPVTVATMGFIPLADGKVLIDEIVREEGVLVRAISKEREIYEQAKGSKERKPTGKFETVSDIVIFDMPGKRVVIGCGLFRVFVAGGDDDVEQSDSV